MQNWERKKRGINLNSAVETAARERREHKESRFADAAGGWMLHLPGEAGNVLHIHSNDFVYVFLVFFCGHSIAASRINLVWKSSPVSNPETYLATAPRFVRG